MAGAVAARITTIIIVVLFKGTARTVVSYEGFRMQTLIASRSYLALHGMNAFMRTIDRDGKHDHEEKLRNKFQGDHFSHEMK